MHNATFDLKGPSDHIPCEVAMMPYSLRNIHAKYLSSKTFEAGVIKYQKCIMELKISISTP